MTAITSPPSSSEQRIVLSNIAWETYECLLADHLDISAPRFAYDRGLLEIVSPSSEHEKDNRTLALMVEVVAEEFGIDVLNVGSMTFRRQDLLRGFEPDSSFYIQHEALVRARVQLDPSVDPPPDLVIEIDITNPSLNMLPIYASVGVPEVWRSQDHRVSVLRLAGDSYRVHLASVVLPPLTGDVLTHFLAESRTLPRIAWLRALRAWVRDQSNAADSTS